MDRLTFGVTMLVCGMGGTLVTLGLMSLVMALLGRAFPDKAGKGAKS
jgi:hypothetical protein